MISVVIIAYNQMSSLVRVVSAFSRQENADTFEIVVVDDGSTDGLESLSEEKLSQVAGRNIQLIHTNNGGRAKARNMGMTAARGEWIVFCDGDRVPAPGFIQAYTDLFKRADIGVGIPFDYFGKLDFIDEGCWKRVKRYARIPPFFKQAANLVEQQSEYAWLGFLAGNLGIRKSCFTEVGGFDERFIDWGFEHFDLGLRLQKQGYPSTLLKSAVNYHLPHARPQGFYEIMLEKNIRFFTDLHPEVDAAIMRQFLIKEKAEPLLEE